jgi:hypothetical protein
MRFLILSVSALLISACSGKGSSAVGPIAVNLSPGAVSVDIGGTQKFTAAVTGTAEADVTWALSGTGCVGDSCGTISNSGTYTAPDDPPSPATVTITATSSFDPTKSASAVLTVTTRSNSGFSGKYGFLFNGFELSNVAVAIAGSFTADGNGRVTGGTLDMNRGTGVQTVPITGGAYAFGADNRGRLSLVTPQETLFFRFAMSAANPPSHNGRLICFQPGDLSRLTGSGVIKKQTTAAFSMSAFNGDFAVSLSGELNSTNAVGAIGRFHLDGLGAINQGAMDLNLTGTSYSNAATTGTYTPIDPMTGRGSASLSFPAPINQLNFTFYVVSPTEAFFVGAETRGPTRPLLSGRVLKQSGGPYAANSMTGTLVLNTTGLNANGSEVTIGRFEASAPTASLSGIVDKNEAGTIVASAAFTGTYDIAANGRGTLNSQLGASSRPYAFYMVDQNRAFLMESETLEAGVGFVEAQSGTPFTTASLSGNYVVGTASPAECGCTSVSGVVSLNGSDGTFLGARDKSRPEGLIPRDSWAGNFAIQAGSGGRGTLTSTLPSTENSVLYVISPEKVVLINVDAMVHVSVVTILEK